MSSLTTIIAKARSDLLEEIERFQAAHDMPDSTFSRRAMGDPGFLAMFRRGRKIEPETIEAVQSFMRAYRPLKRRAGNATATA